MELKNLEKLYMHELKDLYSVEKQISEIMPKIIKKANSEKLKKALKNHSDETSTHLKRIEEIIENYDCSPTGHKCKGMEGIIKEAEEVLEEVCNDDTIDAAIISMCNRMEHYELAGYGTARAFAEQLNKPEEANKLIKTLNEESAADQLLSTIAWRDANPEAQSQMSA